MNNEYLSLTDIIDAQNDILRKEKELYISSAKNINMRFNKLLTANLGSKLVEMCASDISGEIVRRYFDTSDYHITVDQMFDRIINFSYENDNDVFEVNDSIKKDYYNINDSNNSQRVKEIREENQNNQRQLFTEDRNTDKLDKKGKAAYREKKTTSDGKIYDDLTGKEGSSKTINKNGKEVKVSELHADHIQARESIMFNEKYIRSDKKEEMKKFYNSEDNMQMMHGSANSSKKDVRVCIIDGKEEYLQSNEMNSRINKGEKIQDITSSATEEQLCNATTSQWEKETNGKKIEKLKEEGYLDENGKVKKEVKEKLIKNIKKSQEKESIEILKNTDYKKVSGDAANRTKKSVKKMLIGQIVYYALPPLVFETQEILKKDNITIDNFLREFKERSKRVMNYVVSKLEKIFKTVFENSVTNFIKIFFEILVDVVKGTIKRLMNVIKSVAISLVNCIKIICSKETSRVEKADAVSKIVAVTVSGIILEVIFEYVEKQFNVPDKIAEPLQIIATVITTNLIMIMLEKVDLFNVKHGLLISNMEQVFEEENNRYMEKTMSLLTSGSEKINLYMDQVKNEISNIKEGITILNMYEDDSSLELEKINKIFNMDIDFEDEWKVFVGKE